MGSSPEITDDDDSFEQPRRSARLKKNVKQKGKAKKATVIQSSEEDSDATIDYEETIEIITSDEDSELPEVNLQANLAQRDKIIGNLFKPNTEIRPECSYQPAKQSAVKPVTAPQPQLPGYVEMIGGVQVHFPVPPYGSQKALMFKVITGINKRQNCLLESPTGSGKTLALLCGALAWQRQEKNRLLDFQMQPSTTPHESPRCSQTDFPSTPPPPKNWNPDKLFSQNKFGERSIYDKSIPNTNTDNQNTELPEANLVKIHKKRKYDDFNPSESPKSLTVNSVHTSTPIQTGANQSKLEHSKIQSYSPQKNFDWAINIPDSPRKNTANVDDTFDEQAPSFVKIPIIYYGARTHKQIQQVVKEFSRTAYCGEAKMTILSSREHSCIREFDKTLYHNKNDMCRECVSKVRVPKVNDTLRAQYSTNCKYYENRKNLNHSILPPAFDLEDLVETGKDMGGCPYYAARLMTPNAQIVFCPYNYLIDPGIRNSMQIKIQDEIVILDEAHNIEDICREAATFTITREQIQGSLTELDNLLEYQHRNQDIYPNMVELRASLKNWDEWFGHQVPLINKQPVNNNESVYVWQVIHFATSLNNHNIGVNHLQSFKWNAEVFNNKLSDDPGSLFGATVTGPLLESLSTALGYLYREDGKYLDDFKPALIRSYVEHYDRIRNSSNWRSSNDNSSTTKEQISLRFMCMNSAIVFDALKSARCIVLSSGTLTPLISLHSELGTDFPLQVSPNHVIPRDRVWIGTLSSCPDGSPLECKSASTGQVSVQDAIGETVLWVAQVTPGGVLCFLPSYQLMNKLTKRWKETGLWTKLESTKNLFMESRNIKDHTEIMDDYYYCVTTSKGALLFAVYRGKVSEGMDFKDQQARAVITIGIPYPNTFDMMVREKMNYNDRHVQDKNLLPSSEWLRVQAYRALNQAVGRCVRHRQDWGAVLLVDARFTQDYYTQHLSKWVKQFLGGNHHSFETLVNSPNSLESFMQNMTLSEKEPETPMDCDT